MYVCLCKGITDSQIRSAVQGGAHNLRQVRESLDIMTQCGKCAGLTKDLMNDILNDINAGNFYSAA